jgi:hypothetical protein
MMELLNNYIDELLSGIEFLITLGSMISLLGLIVGFIFFIWGGNRMRGMTIGVIIVSFILLGVCGFSIGLKYFRIFH